MENLSLKNRTHNYNDLYVKLVTKLKNNNIYFLVNKDLMFENTVKKIPNGSVLIRSGIKLPTDVDVFTFTIMNKNNLENDNPDEDEFGLIKISVDVIIERLLDKELQPMGVVYQESDAEISSLVN
jgi:hypothetical protein